MFEMDQVGNEAAAALTSGLAAGRESGEGRFSHSTRLEGRRRWAGSP